MSPLQRATGFRACETWEGGDGQRPASQETCLSSHLSGVRGARTGQVGSAFSSVMGILRTLGLEEIFETYYSYGFTEATKVTLDYQFINNPAYNTQRGPANAFAVRLHTQF